MSEELENPNGVAVLDSPPPPSADAGAPSDELDPISRSLGGDTTAFDDAPAAPAPVAPSEVVAEPAAGPISFRDLATQYGHYDLAGIQDEAQAQQELFHRHNEAMQLAALAQQFLPYREQFQQFLQWQQQAQNPRTAPGPQPQYNGYQQQPLAPQWNDNWQNFLWQNPRTGETEFKPGTPLEVMEGVKNYARYKQQFEQNPLSVLQPTMQSMADGIRQQLAQDVQRQIQSVRTHDELQGFIDRNANWLYQVDASGRPIRNPQTGQEMYSPAGFEFANHVARLNQAGVTDPRAKIQLAALMMSRRLEDGSAAASPTPAAPAPVPAPAANQASRSLRNVAKKLGSRGNSVRQAQVPEGPPQNSRLPFSEKLKQQLKADGFTDDNLDL